MINLSQLQFPKRNFIACLLVALSIIGCKKSNLPAANQIYLPVKYNDQMNHEVSTYQYDSQNRVIDISSIDTISAAFVPSTIGSSESKIIYDNNNRVAQTSGYINGVFSGTTTYTYSAGLVSIHNVFPSLVSNVTEMLDNNNRISHVTSPGEYETYTYDSAGRVLSFSGIDSALSATIPQIVITYSYDSQKGAFSDVVGYSNTDNENGSKNNLANIIVTYPLQSSASSTISNKYTYNSAGYPTSCISTVVTGKVQQAIPQLIRIWSNSI